MYLDGEVKLTTEISVDSEVGQSMGGWGLESIPDNCNVRWAKEQRPNKDYRLEHRILGRS